MIPTKTSDKYKYFREKYQTFVFEKFSYHINNSKLRIIFYFSIEGLVKFQPEIEVSVMEKSQIGKLDKSELESIIFNLGMVELVSYWKATCSPELIIKPFKLNQSQIEFYKKLYFNGLGEFFHLNKIKADYENFINFKCDSNIETLSFDFNANNSNLIPVGGGKDSVVSLELLKKDNDKNFAMIINPRGASLKSVEIAGLSNRLIKVKRSISPDLLDLNKQGFLNGHTPFSAIVAFIGLLVSYIYNIKYIALSNESSANESTVPGTNVNHQYSKSFEFEKDVSNYIENHITDGIKYFSLLRPLSEFQIAALFSKYENYHLDFRSCNAGSKKNIWCGKCPKCLFTFIILSPFIKPEKLTKIFGHNLLDDKEMEKYFNELTGLSEIKPFECVGTIDEVIASLCFAREFYKDLPYLLQKFNKSGLNESCKEIDKKSLLFNLNNEHNVEPGFLDLIENELSNKLN